MRSGYVNLALTAGTFRVASVNGYGWSSRASSTRYDGSILPSSYELGFTTSIVSSSNGPYDRWHGNPLRCLSTVLDM